MVLGLKPVGKPTTLKKPKIWTEPGHCTCGETKYLDEIKVLDKTQVLHGPWTQTYEETNYLKEI